MKQLTVAALLISVISGAAHAREPAELDAIQRESRIVADVMKSVFSNELRDQTHVARVEAEYIAPQGVLVSVHLNQPWISFRSNEPRVNISSFQIGDVPPIVQNILQELQIDIGAFEPEALQELRQMRNEQRVLRQKQRTIRAKQRDISRQMIRTSDDEIKQRLQKQLDELHEDLDTADAEYELLDNDITSHYRLLKEEHDVFAIDRQQDQEEDNISLDQLVANTACDYGGTLKSLDKGEYLTIALRRGRDTRYFSFEMDDIHRCSRSDLEATELLEKAYLYDKN